MQEHSAALAKMDLTQLTIPPPEPYEEHMLVGMTLNGDTVEKLGELTFRLVKWIITLPILDLTLKEHSPGFEAPESTSVWPTSHRTPFNPLALIASNVVYSRFVCLAPFHTCH